MLYKGYNQQAVAIVDAFSTGHFLGPAFRSRGVPVIHIRNRNAACESQIATFHSHDYNAYFDFTGDVIEIADKLSSWGVRHVVAGIESGSDVADLLSNAINSPTANTPGFDKARRDKRVMHQLLYKAGVSIPWQQHLDINGDVIWETEGTEPNSVVVKPAASAGTDNVRICHTPIETEIAIKKCLEQTNVYGQKNIGVVVQEYLEGEEYMVNTVSVNGIHVVIEVWRSVKKLINSNPVYDYQILEDPTNPKIKKIIDYVAEVLTVLGVKWGPGHTEVIVTSRGPLLLETATRMPGGVDPSLGLFTIGRSLIDEVVEVYLAPHIVVERGQIRPLRKAAMGISLISPCSGVLTRPLDLRPIMELPSFHGVRIPVQVGDYISQTIDLFTKPGGLYLCHEDQNQLNRDYEAVREWENIEFSNAVRGV
ncbi:ATP-grasp domain-containing protein [Anoxybacillus rupiensis]|uniref:ATP-grasp domain-containing protein n=1 Tax=Anoxybacteroides rupiense TaxID=311460 RepID=A0ABD5J0J8_9BACL|nr:MULTISPECIES: ATP-grasp domain-containing protein [Anoxybacillus]MBS2772782.1 ATP-grasp domain-containing protein [Anoxybacillus rupiensis]MDE8565743.1 ATP-grasp domain-containing protein [Anoxybacillus rupiensis]MED5053696.1 ATP-grasp domain-containing protein [Anoxybacillus rupiensis]QHC04478.1 ATP-grasp domain-containing protein [Anoxybacillus sp. PDR2]